MAHPARRKGAVRRSDIPPDVLIALNEGREETITLVEWLAVDTPTLLKSILEQTGLAEVGDRLGRAVIELADKGVTDRLRGMGQALFVAIEGHPKREKISEALATHTSDMVRAWACFMQTADRSLDLVDRLERTRRFASDRSVAVRECSWDSFRPYVAADLKLGLQLLETWVKDPDPNIRRCATEATRPRGVWCAHILELKENPELGLDLLEPVRSDPIPYVQRSVANWLNDASKSRPDWVRAVCTRWLTESPTKETAWIVNHALRTIRKKERS